MRDQTESDELIDMMQQSLQEWGEYINLMVQASLGGMVISCCLDLMQEIDNMMDKFME